ncbi:MAG: ribosome assembly RNA-binding protein YhbY [Bacillota bacterium]|nr:ribosome assembly RNA-binding protein YhbY [Bacillota bacterium]
MITSKQRAYLRGLANTIPALYQIGKGGVNEAVIKQLGEALEANELIKVKILENSDLELKTCAAQVADKTNSNIVQCIGKVFVLYRPRSDKEKRKIIL